MTRAQTGRSFIRWLECSIWFWSLRHTLSCRASLCFQLPSLLDKLAGVSRVTYLHKWTINSENAGLISVCPCPGCLEGLNFSGMSPQRELPRNERVSATCFNQLFSLSGHGAQCICADYLVLLLALKSLFGCTPQFGASWRMQERANYHHRFVVWWQIVCRRQCFSRQSQKTREYKLRPQSAAWPTFLSIL